MRSSLTVLLLAALATASCSRPIATHDAQVQHDVRAFMSAVAHDITQEGPPAWRRQFADIPAFFMAVNGRLEYRDSASATEGIQNVARLIRRIELTWGDDLRVDPLAPALAAVATTYHESIDLAAGNHVSSTGYFTAVAEDRQGRWQFRNCHWSELPAPPPAP